MRFIFYFLSLIAGLGLTLQVGLNGELRGALGSPILTSFISFVVGSTGLGIAYAAAVACGVQTLPLMDHVMHSQWWMWIGGLFGAFYIFTSIFAAPKIGFANMFCLVIAGQIIMAVLFDHFGVFGNAIHTINPYRMAGIALLIFSVYIIQTH